MKSFWTGLAFYFAILGFCLRVAANTDFIEPLDLKPFVGKSQFDRLGITPWLPHGRHVANGVPFQIDGVIELYGTSAIQQNLQIRTNVPGIPVNRSFQAFHLLCATTGGSPTKDVPVAHIRLRYADGSSNTVSILFGRHIRQWWGPRHEEDSALADPRCKPAWSMELSPAAKSDKRSRFFHSILSNPAPTKVVQSIDLESAVSIAGLMLAAISTGPVDASALANTLPNLPPDADNATRTGELSTLEGVVRLASGETVSNAVVKVVGVRSVKSSDFTTYSGHPTIGQETHTDSLGRFQFKKVPDDVVYRVLILSLGFKPYLFFGADPKRGPIDIYLEPEHIRTPSLKYHLAGRVVDLQKRPVMGAIVEVDGVGVESMTRWSGSEQFETEVTDTEGRFLFERDDPFTRLQVKVQAPGCAMERQWLAIDGTNHVVDVGPGAAIVGRVIKEGNPVAGVQIGISGAERSVEVYAGNYTAITDAQGTFTLRDLPPHKTWMLYGGIDSLKPHGTIRPRSVASSNRESTNDLGNVEVTPGLTLSGTVQSRTAAPFPPNLKVQVSFDSIPQSISVPITENGTFSATGLFSGGARITVLGSTSWNLSPVNRSLDSHNPNYLVGRLEGDKTDLLLMIEQKPRLDSFYPGNGMLPPNDDPRNQPLWGAENSGPPWVRFAGKVTDVKSGQPLAVKVTPGRKPPTAKSAPTAQPLLQTILEPLRSKSVPFNERIFWDYARVETFTNGQFSILLPQNSCTTVLRVEADGYRPFESEPQAGKNTNFVVELIAAAGPGGVVLQPDGKPAADAMLFYAASGEQFSLRQHTLSTFGKTPSFRTTGRDGTFSFSIRLGAQRLYVSHPSGWASVPAEKLTSEEEIQLQPWAVVTGILTKSNGVPVATEKLAIVGDMTPNSPFVTFQERVITDEKGRFTFQVVPPGEWQLMRLQPMPGRASSWSYVLQRRITVIPGKTNDLENVILDTPPPPSLTDLLKKKIGL